MITVDNTLLSLREWTNEKECTATSVQEKQQSIDYYLPNIITGNAVKIQKAHIVPTVSIILKVPPVANSQSQNQNVLGSYVCSTRLYIYIYIYQTSS